MHFKYFLLCLILSVCTNISIFAQQGPVDLIAGDTTAFLGDELQVKIKVKGFTDILSFQASINWDASMLTYKSISNFGVKDLDLDDFGTSSVDQGHLRFVWTPDDAVSASLEDSAVLFTAIFDVISNNQSTTTIGFHDQVSDPAFPIEFANKDYDILNVNTHEGTIQLIENITGLEDSSTKFKIFPNPFNDRVQISNPDLSIQYLSVFNAEGALLEERFDIKEKFIDLYISGSSEGIYFINVKKGKSLLTRKIVKSLKK